MQFTQQRTSDGSSGNNGSETQTTGIGRSDASEISSSGKCSQMSSTKKAMKKKTVTFKCSLETSDDLNIVMKEPNLNITPPQPIIKRESLSRAIKVARGSEPIVRESRLDQKLKNFSGYSIDKLNSLSFRSLNSGIKEDGEDDGDGNEGDDDADSRRNNSDETDSEHHEHSGDGENGDDRHPSHATARTHSHRTRKPNKKFLDDAELAHLQNSKKSRRKSNKDYGERMEKSDIDKTFLLKIDGLVDGEASSSKGKLIFTKIIDLS